MELANQSKLRPIYTKCNTSQKEKYSRDQLLLITSIGVDTYCSPFESIVSISDIKSGSSIVAREKEKQTNFCYKVYASTRGLRYSQYLW